MNRWLSPFCLLCVTLIPFNQVLAETQTNVDKAREALAKQEGDEDSAKQLEEVFQAAEKNYSLLKKGGKSLSYSFDYSYFGDQRLDLEIVDNNFRNADITPSATHTFTNTFSFDYGLLDNVTANIRVPLSSKYDTQQELSNTNMGDISLSLRWQPNPYVPGKPSFTVFGSFKTRTGVSPYEIDLNRQLSSGSGTYSFSTGVSASKVLDPVVLFGSLSFSHGFKTEGLNQVRGSQVLTAVKPADSLSLSAGFSYSLSYDVSLSASFQLGYSDETFLTLRNAAGSVGKVKSQDSMSSVVNFSLGTRLSEKTILNTNFGFGITEDSPDVILGISLPISLEGLKE